MMDPKHYSKLSETQRRLVDSMMKHTTAKAEATLPAQFVQQANVTPPSSSFTSPDVKVKNKPRSKSTGEDDKKMNNSSAAPSSATKFSGSAYENSPDPSVIPLPIFDEAEGVPGLGPLKLITSPNNSSNNGNNKKSQKKHLPTAVVPQQVKKGNGQKK